MSLTNKRNKTYYIKAKYQKIAGLHVRLFAAVKGLLTRCI